jgi:hypothetical protein
MNVVGMVWHLAWHFARVAGFLSPQGSGVAEGWAESLSAADCGLCRAFGVCLHTAHQVSECTRSSSPSRISLCPPTWDAFCPG